MLVLLIKIERYKKKLTNFKKFEDLLFRIGNQQFFQIEILKYTLKIMNQVFVISFNRRLKNCRNF